MSKIVLGEKRKEAYTADQKRQLDAYKDNIFADNQQRELRQSDNNIEFPQGNDIINTNMIRTEIEEQKPEKKVALGSMKEKEDRIDGQADDFEFSYQEQEHNQLFNVAQEDMLSINEQEAWEVDEKDIAESKEHGSSHAFRQVAYDMAESKVVAGATTSYQNMLDGCISYAKLVENGYDNLGTIRELTSNYFVTKGFITDYLRSHRRSPWSTEGKKRVYWANAYLEMMKISEDSILKGFLKSEYPDSLVEELLAERIPFPASLDEVKDGARRYVTIKKLAKAKTAKENAKKTKVKNNLIEGDYNEEDLMGNDYVTPAAYDYMLANRDVHNFIDYYKNKAAELLGDKIKDKSNVKLQNDAFTRQSYVAFLDYVRFDSKGNVIEEDSYKHEKNMRILQLWLDNEDKDEALFEAFDNLLLKTVNGDFEYKGTNLDDYTYNDALKQRMYAFRGGTINNILSNNEICAEAWRESRGITKDMLKFFENHFGKGQNLFNEALKKEAGRHGLDVDKAKNDIFELYNEEDHEYYVTQVFEKDTDGLEAYTADSYNVYKEEAEKGDVAKVNLMHGFAGKTFAYDITGLKKYYAENN